GRGHRHGRPPADGGTAGADHAATPDGGHLEGHPPVRRRIGAGPRGGLGRLTPDANRLALRLRLYLEFEGDTTERRVLRGTGGDRRAEFPGTLPEPASDHRVA